MLLRFYVHIRACGTIVGTSRVAVSIGKSGARSHGRHPPWQAEGGLHRYH